MRSRTELVTTLFIDSEDDETNTEDSEEDWRPDISHRRSKARKARRNKRKVNSSIKIRLDLKRRKAEYANELEKCLSITANSSVIVDQRVPISKKQPVEKNFPDKSGYFHLYLYKKDLDQDYINNSHLCLWRRDGSSLLQKYIRVKTDNNDEFMFTSSSVYSSWDERRRKEFHLLVVKCIEGNNKRVRIADLEEFHNMANGVLQHKIEDLTDEKEEEEDEEEEEEEEDVGQICNEFLNTKDIVCSQQDVAEEPSEYDENIEADSESNSNTLPEKEDDDVPE